jgi:LCP family protein required for cell wall assembly
MQRVTTQANAITDPFPEDDPAAAGPAPDNEPQPDPAADREAQADTAPDNGPKADAAPDGEEQSEPASDAQPAPGGADGEQHRSSRGRHRSPLWAKLAISAGVLLMLLSGGAIAASRMIIHEATSNIVQTTLLEGEAAAPPRPSGQQIDGALNLLLVGIDVRPGWDSGARSDTIMIMHIPASHDQAYMISIPRDWRVPIPSNPELRFRGRTDKINAAFAFGYQGEGTETQKRARGVSLLAQTLHRQTGLTFNGAAIIDFQGFEAVVRELDGVDMCVDQRASSIHLGYDRNGNIVPISFDEDSHRVFDIPPGGHRVVHEIGCRRMSAKLALDYARIRYGLPKTDYDRQRHQQQLIKAIGEEATSKGVLTDLGKLNRVIAAAGKAFVLDTQGVPLADFLFTLRGVTANDAVVLKTNGGSYNGMEINGISYESMSEESMAMLHSARDGKLPEFVLAHPDVRQDAVPRAAGDTDG